MSLIAWDNESFPFCTPEDVAKEINDLAIPLMTGNQGVKETILEEKISLAKDRVKEMLQLRFPKLYAATVREWIQYDSMITDQQREQSRKQFDQTGDAYIQQHLEYNQYRAGNAWFYGTQLQPHMPPITFYNFGIPVYGLFNGIAKAGSVLVNTDDSELYVQIGTLDNTAWKRFEPEDLINNIANPEVLKRVAVAATLCACLNQSDMSFRATWQDNPKVLEGLSSKWEKELCARFEAAVGLMKIDMDGNGTITEFERSRTRSNRAWIV